MKKLYKIEIDGDKTYLTRWFMGELLITDIGYRDRGFNPRHEAPIAVAKDAILRGIRNRRRALQWIEDTISTRCEEYFFKIIQNEKLKIVNEEKKPKNRTKYVGVEIEFISLNDQSEIKNLFIQAGLEKYVNLTTDGSVRDTNAESDCDGSCREDCECYDCNEHCNDNCEGDHDWECNCECNCGDNGHEIRILAPQSKIFNIISQVCKVLKECDAKVNKTCGLHVHLDMRSRNVAKCFNNLVVVQPLLYSMVPTGRRTNGFCSPNKDKEFKEVDSRYKGINPNSFKKHRTLEVRLHSGTVNATKINNWITLLIAVVEHDTKLHRIKTIAGVQKRLGLSTELVTYIKERSVKFTNVNTFDIKNLEMAA